MHLVLTVRPTMRRSHLIQRLNKPTGYPNPFAFGGSLSYGGLSDEAVDLLADVFSFDYMAAAEFEHGAVPGALSFLYDLSTEGRLVNGTHRNVFYIAPREYEQGVKETIDQLISDETELNLKRGCRLSGALKFPDDALSVGWLELDNGFFFFIDEEMFEKTKQLFGLK